MVAIVLLHLKVPNNSSECGESFHKLAKSVNSCLQLQFWSHSFVGLTTWLPLSLVWEKCFSLLRLALNIKSRTKLHIKCAVCYMACFFKSLNLFSAILHLTLFQVRIPIIDPQRKGTTKYLISMPDPWVNCLRVIPFTLVHPEYHTSDNSTFPNWIVHNADCRLTADHCFQG